MAIDFKKFKKGRAKLTKAISQMKTETTSYNDERFWVPKKDKSGSAEAVIRFLPQQDLEKAPSIKVFNHFFKERGQYFVENCPSTLGKDCPVCEFVKPLWDEDEDLAKKYNRGAQYTTNILVVKDPACPENEGQVFMYKHGKKIMDKILEKIIPESDLDEPIQIYDMWKGANFKLKIKQKAGYPNYDSSEFYNKEVAVAKTDDDIEAIYEKIYDLDEFLEEKQFKSAKDIEKKFNKILGLKSAKPENKKVDGEETDDMFEEKEEVKTKSTGDDAPIDFEDDDDFDFGDDNDDVPF